MNNKVLLMSAVIFILSGCDNSLPSQALGTLERDRIILTATANEIIRAQPIAEGSVVHQGDVLVKLDTKQQEAVLARARAEEAKAQAYLLRLTNGERPEDIAASAARLERAKATLLESQQYYQRINRLVQQKLLSDAERDSARAELDAAKADVDSASEGLAKLTSGERPEDIRQAQAALAAENAEVVLQQQVLNDLTVVATRDGILDSLPYNVGERVSMSSIVAAIQADTLPYARVYVPEPYRVHLQVGDVFTVHVDGMVNSYQGTLRWIATEPAFTPYYALNEEDRARLVYLAEIELPESAIDLPAGVPVQVDMPND
ncbi:HlyD family secretion protein [Photobacterium nomapromontoriensis]|uniref:HlyD family secretion protein n=1 Tax=Photobacterium nomapromontoriensis TaxID=2910237 RepID=UPI003D105E70